MLSVFTRRPASGVAIGETVDPTLLLPAAGAVLWVDLAAPTEDELRILSDVFHLHPLSVEDARSAIQFPKVETYPGYLYLVLHGIDVEEEDHVATRDIDFFVGPNYLVTVHDGGSRSIARLRRVCSEHDHILSEGPVALMHRIVDLMVDNYSPAMDGIERRIDELEEQAFLGQERMIRQVLALRRDLAFMRRVLVPQRDAIARLARREFPSIGDEMAYRFRDVHDHVVRLADEVILFQERLTGILDVNYAVVSNRLNEVMKVLTVMSTIFLPLTVLTGMWGMNVPLPYFAGGERTQFWWVLAMMSTISLAMIVVFRRRGWL